MKLIISTLVVAMHAFPTWAKDYSEADATRAAEVIAQSALGGNVSTTVQTLLEPTTIESRPAVSRAAEQLARHPYEEVNILLFYRLDKELNRQKPNSMVVRSLLKAIARTGSADWLADLRTVSRSIRVATGNMEDRGKAEATNAVLGTTIAALNVGRPHRRSLADGPELPVEAPRPALAAAEAETDGPPSFAELVEKSENPVAIEDFLEQTNFNFYENAVNKLLTPRPQDINYYGRADEVRKMAEGLNRMERGHILLTGKAGVGKTTLLKILMDRYLSGDATFPGAEVPLIFEIPITTLAEKSPDPMIAVVKMAQLVGEQLGRHVILFADEAHVSSTMVRHGLKAYLTQMLREDHSLVHLVWATTAKEARELTDDSAFRRRWTDVFVPEFSKEDTLELINEVFIPQWKLLHQRDGYEFAAIDEEALHFAFRNGHLEQMHAGQPTPTKELLEGAIVHKLESLKVEAVPAGPFELTTSDIQSYLRFQKNLKIVPGDPRGMAAFEELWEEFETGYTGNEGFKYQLKERLRHYFLSPHLEMMEALTFFGPPGGGKTYAAGKIADIFFNGAMLNINGADYRESHTKSRATGAPPGYVGFKERVSAFTSFFADHPHGGVIKIEEADYMHEDMVKMFTNMITDKQFTDGYGNVWRTDQYVLIMNSNLGQEFLVPPDVSQLMTWEQYEARRLALMEKRTVDGKEVEFVRDEALKQTFERFIQRIVTDSNPGEDTSAISQEAAKQRRRYHPLYVLSPERSDLLAAAEIKWQEFSELARDDYDVNFDLAEGVIERVLNVDAYEFEKGYSFAVSQLERGLTDILKGFLSERGQTLEVRFEGEELVVSNAGVERRFSSPLPTDLSKNPWAKNEAMLQKIGDFEVTMARQLKGHEELIRSTKSKLQLKLKNWNTRLVFTVLGTSGNGKTEFAKALARTLFGDEKAMRAISGLNSVYELNDYFRSSTGFVGSQERTEFESWFENQSRAGGGVILLDELLSFAGLGREGVAERVRIINKFYDLLDEGMLKVGNRRLDARGFVVVITGNAMQEFFDHIEDVPDAEKLVARVLETIGETDIVDYFRRLGLDAAKIARFGKITLKGPLSAETSLQVGKKILAQMSAEALGETAVDLKVEDAILEGIVGKVKTVRLGMRKVNGAIAMLVTEPIAGILFHFPQTKKLEARLNAGAIEWFADGKQVVLRVLTDDSVERSEWTLKSKTKSTDRLATPQFEAVQEEPKTKLSPLQIQKTAVHEVYGHWMASVLLNGRNTIEAISIIPGNGFLGFVRQLDEKEYTASSLTTILKRIVYLEAGHRAVFLKGIYGVGGGSTGGDEKRRHDDLAKVNRAMDQILGNQLISTTADFDSEEARQSFKQNLRDVLKQVTDLVLRFGFQSGKFDPIYETAVKERFLSQIYMDKHVTKIRSELQDPDFIFLFFLDQVLAHREEPELKELWRKSLLEVKALRSHGEPMKDDFKTWLDTKIGTLAPEEIETPLDCELLLGKGA